MSEWPPPFRLVPSSRPAPYPADGLLFVALPPGEQRHEFRALRAVEYLDALEREALLHRDARLARALSRARWYLVGFLDCSGLQLPPSRW